MLDQLGPEQAQRVRTAMVDLGDVDPHEQRRVVDEFFRVGPMVPQKDPPGIDLDGRLARRLSSQTTHAGAPSFSHAGEATPFLFLHETEADKLARILAGERPQTVALVLSHLPPQRAGNVLARLESALQVEVIHRLVDLEETDPEILREVEHAIELRLSQQVHMQRRRVAGLEAVTGIFKATGGRIGAELLDNLARHDRPLAERLGPPAITFDELVRLGDAALTLLLEAASPELAMTALVGAAPELIDRVLRRLPAEEAAIVRHKLDHPGPLRLSDLEDAQQQIVDLARRLAVEGRIELAGMRD